MPTAWTYACGACLAGLLVAEMRDAQWGRWLCKPLASACFCAQAWALGAAASPYGQLILAGQLLGLGGDVLLVARAEWAFVAGLAVFLAGHVAFGVAFFGAAAPAAPVLALAGLGATGAAIGLHRWLLPHVPGQLRWPVRAYLLVISAMVVASASAGPARQPAAAVGALLFYLSDICVARGRFVRPGAANALVGLPLYYAAQLLLAVSVAARP